MSPDKDANKQKPDKAAITKEQDKMARDEPKNPALLDRQAPGQAGGGFVEGEDRNMDEDDEYDDLPPDVRASHHDGHHPPMCGHSSQPSGGSTGGANPWYQPAPGGYYPQQYPGGGGGGPWGVPHMTGGPPGGAPSPYYTPSLPFDGYYGAMQPQAQPWAPHPPLRDYRPLSPPPMNPYAMPPNFAMDPNSSASMPYEDYYETAGKQQQQQQAAGQRSHRSGHYRPSSIDQQQQPQQVPSSLITRYTPNKAPSTITKAPQSQHPTETPSPSSGPSSAGSTTSPGTTPTVSKGDKADVQKKP